MKDISSKHLLKHYYETTAFGQLFDLEILDHARLFEYANGELVCEYAVQPSHLLFQVEGKTKIFNMLENGRAYLLRIESPFQILGDAEMLEDLPYIANVEALPGCACIGIPIGYVRQMYSDNPAFLRFLVKSLSGRLERISEMSTVNLLLPLKAKVASYIAAHTVDGKLAEIRTSYVDVADQLGCTYRHLSRTLKGMEEEGLIGRQGKSIVIKDLEKLEQVADTAYRY